MKNIMKNSLLSLVLIGLTACGSTPYVPPTEYPLVTVHSDDEYEWDKNYSYAKNISMMVRPSGLGFGVDDEKDPLKASNNRQGALSSTLSMVNGFASAGIFGALSFGILDSNTDKGRAWSPILVDFMPVSELPDPKSPTAYLTIRNLIEGNIKQALTSNYPNMEWDGAVFTTTKYQSTNTGIIFYDDSCDDAYNTGNQSTPYKKLNWNFKAPFFEKSSLNEQGRPYCALTFEPSITGKVMINNIAHWIITSRTAKVSVNTFYLLALNKNYVGHILNPKFFLFTHVMVMESHRRRFHGLTFIRMFHTKENSIYLT
ncbi:hypothetical protein L3081_24315 [Colwellia sp. MSW7]|uniref:Lipoprotein n=1 Tax=Colwellia maritima TaxID=2912588 RepID=A0ABS9X6V8_9GAMM|nr:hypothetical protein [Colwellia maritima]MCI2285954.1 hypothetical protein [Colwellia maritima]